MHAHLRISLQPMRAAFGKVMLPRPKQRQAAMPGLLGYGTLPGYVRL